MNARLEDEGGLVASLQRKIKELQVLGIYLLKIYLGKLNKKALTCKFTKKVKKKLPNIHTQLFLGPVADTNYDIFVFIHYRTVIEETLLFLYLN